MAFISSLSSSVYDTKTTAYTEADTQYPAVSFDMKISGINACVGEDLWRREVQGIFSRRIECGASAEPLCWFCSFQRSDGINKCDNESTGLTQGLALNGHASESPESSTSVDLPKHAIAPEQPTRYSSASSFTSTASGPLTGINRSHATAASSWSRSQGYSFANAHSLAMAARKRHSMRLTSNQEYSIPAAPDIPATTAHDNLHTAASTERKTQEYYIRRAQERIKRQKPVRRLRFQDKEAEELAAEIAASLEILRLPNQNELEYTEADVELQLQGLSRAAPAFRGLESPRPMWSSGWDSLFDDESAGAELTVHAPRAIRPIKLAEMLEKVAQKFERLAEEPF